VTELTGHVLVVDDLDNNRNVLVRLLQKEGLTTNEAVDGIDALEKVKNGRYDTILLDVMMPRLDGLGALAALKENRDTADIPVIMLSAFNESKAVLDCIALGADDFLQKPIDRALLRARLSSCLRRKHLQDREREHLIQLEASNLEHRRLNQLKSRFLAVAAHDLKNPMSTVLLLVDKLLQMDEAAVTLAEQKLVARRIRDSIHRMLGIVQGLMDSAVYESEHFALRRRIVDLTAMVRFVLDENRIYAASKRIDLQGFLPEHMVMVDADEMRIKEILDNLVNNAIKFSPLDRGVQISLTTSAELEPMALITVRDHGPGFTEEDKQSVFGPYQRLSAVPTGGEVSIGIGLSIVKQMAELHGGRVWLESEQGKGATFFLELPMQKSG
jgi:two-component system, sensor histidine kinase and response regulator